MNYLLINCILCKFTIDALHIASYPPIYPPFFTPCTFPSPVHQPIQYRSYCNVLPNLPFICDLHQQLSNSAIPFIVSAFEKLKPVLVKNNTVSIGILIVRQLAPPLSTSEVYRDKLHYDCLFEDECNRMSAEKLEKFVESARIYTAKLYERWFVDDSLCNQPNILALLVLDGLVNDARKLPFVKLFTADVRLMPTAANIQSETLNNILQGWPLHNVLADLIEQLGYALQEFHVLDGRTRVHIVPEWALNVFALCALILALALFVEWYVVRRKLVVKRSITGVQLNAAKSKTHMIFY